MLKYFPSFETLDMYMRETYTITAYERITNDGVANFYTKEVGQCPAYFSQKNGGWMVAIGDREVMTHVPSF